MELEKDTYKSPTGLPLGLLGPSANFFVNSSRIMRAAIDPALYPRTSVHELMDCNVTYLALLALGPSLQQALFSVLNSGLVPSFRACGPALAAMMLGEALDGDASLEIYVPMESGDRLLIVLSRAMQPIPFPTTWPEVSLVLTRQPSRHTVVIRRVPDPNSLSVAEVPYMSSGVVKGPEGYTTELVGLRAYIARRVGVFSSSAPGLADIYSSNGFSVRVFPDPV